MLSSSVLSAFSLFCSLISGAEPPVPPETFLKVAAAAEPVKEFSLLAYILGTNVDMRNYDFYGNELNWRPDCTLPIQSAACRQTGNFTGKFRKFAGLILSTNDRKEEEEEEEEAERMRKWNFTRINALKERYYYSKARDSPDYSVENFCPRLDNQSPSNFDFVIDLMRILLPNLQGSEIDLKIDISGMLLFMTLRIVNDLEGYFDEIRELYTLLKNLADGPFYLGDLEIDSGMIPDRQRLLE